MVDNTLQERDKFLKMKTFLVSTYFKFLPIFLWLTGVYLVNPRKNQFEESWKVQHSQEKKWIKYMLTQENIVA